jgi:hypothetical protein
MQDIRKQGHSHTSTTLDYLYDVERELELALRKKHKPSWKHWQTHSLAYTMNSWGFRGAEPARGGAVFLGCSMTFGLGMSEELVWPTLVADALGTTCTNFGVCATGNDRASVLAWSWFEELEPRWVFWLDRFTSRREWFTSRNKRILQSPDTSTLGRIAASETQTLFDEARNTALVLQSCERVGAQLIHMENPVYHVSGIIPSTVEGDLLSRDNGEHPSRQEHRNIADWFLNQV